MMITPLLLTDFENYYNQSSFQTDIKQVVNISQSVSPWFPNMNAFGKDPDNRFQIVTFKSNEVLDIWDAIQIISSLEY